jgi:hypothetical protein
LDFVGTKSLDGLFLDLEKSHQMPADFLENFRVLSSANTLVAFQDPLGHTRLQHFDIAGDTKPGDLGRKTIDLPAPIGMP